MSINRTAELPSVVIVELCNRQLTHLIAVDAPRARVHLEEWVLDDKLDKWASVNLTKDEAQRVGSGITEEDKLEASEGLVEMQSILRSLV